MPDLNIAEGSPLNGLWVVATMLYPGDAAKRNGLMSVKLIKEVVENGENINIPQAVLLSIIQSHPDGEVSDNAKGRYKYGQISGDVLGFLFQMHMIGHREPSLRKAYYLVSEDYRKTKTFEGETLPSSDKMLRDSFEEFGSVSHLWAAVRELQSMTGKQTGDGRIQYNPLAFALFCLDDKLLRLFLAIAEHLRLFGESFIPSRDKAKSPVLDPATTWRVPAGFPLPPINSVKVTPSAYLLEMLEQYQHAKRDSVRV